MTIENQLAEEEKEETKKYYEERMEFLVREITYGKISRDELLRNRNVFKKLMEDYAKIYGTNNSSLSFTVLQNLLEETN